VVRARAGRGAGVGAEAGVDAGTVFDIEFNAMACECHVLLAAADEAEAAALAQTAIDEVRRIERKYSRYLADSVVGRINAAAGGAAIALDPETDGLLRYAASLYEMSGGRFDISCGVLRRAWDFSVDSDHHLPAAEQLGPLLALTGWPRIEHAHGQLRLPEAGMELDFGGFGKEYAADRAAACLQARGVRSGYVNLGGDLRVIGPQPDGRAWQIGIAHPRTPGTCVASIAVAAGALATSGDYERYFDVDGQRYCHILDPVSGYPVRHWRSVSVLAPLATVAGSCATIAMLCQERGRAFLDGCGFAYLAVDDEGRIHSRGVADGADVHVPVRRG
jgi:thiamine biosynthesis lipoprotein